MAMASAWAGWKSMSDTMGTSCPSAQVNQPTSRKKV
jgi:hypothetical protein